MRPSGERISKDFIAVDLPVKGPLYSYADYRSWDEDKRCELIRGQVWSMSAAPDRRHQALLGLLYQKIAAYLKGKPCKVYIAPFDVLLPDIAEQDDDSIQNVVQPDIVVFCDHSKLKPYGARGAPDLAIEISSPYSIRKDLNEKFRLYERSGVRE